MILEGDKLACSTAAVRIAAFFLAALVFGCSSPAPGVSPVADAFAPDGPKVTRLTDGAQTTLPSDDGPSDGGANAAPTDAIAMEARVVSPVPAAHAPFPQLVYGGGPLLTAPKIVTVVFAGDPFASDLQAFGQSIASSPWWDSVRAGYCASDAGPCVGQGPPGTFVQLTTSPDAAYTDSVQGASSSVQGWLSRAIATATLPAPDANTLYVVYFPSTTTVTLDNYKSCVRGGFGGYHNSMMMGLRDVAYAVVVECTPLPPPLPSVPATSVLQNATLSASHEILEAATDPVRGTGFVLGSTDWSSWPWADLTVGGEAGDLCVDGFGLNQDQTTSGRFTVQRTWSNAQAASGLDPCTPTSTGSVYFNAAPTRSFFVLDVGASATFDVDAFSSAPMADWTLAAQDFSHSTPPSYLSFSIAGGRLTDGGALIRVNNGSKVQVTVTLLKDPSGLDTYVADGAITSVHYGRTVAAQVWPIAVMSSAFASDAGIDAGAGARSLARAHFLATEVRATKTIRSSSRRYRDGRDTPVHALLAP